MLLPDALRLNISISTSSSKRNEKDAVDAKQTHESAPLESEVFGEESTEGSSPFSRF